MTAPSIVAEDDPDATEPFDSTEIAVEIACPRPSIVTFDAVTMPSSPSVLPLLATIARQEASFDCGWGVKRTFDALIRPPKARIGTVARIVVRRTSRGVPASPLLRPIPPWTYESSTRAALNA